MFRLKLGILFLIQFCVKPIKLFSACKLGLNQSKTCDSRCEESSVEQFFIYRLLTRQGYGTRMLYRINHPF